MRPTLVILAAGIGHRYGGLKQVDTIGPSGETIVDYAIYDAARAGFGRVIFVIRKTIEREFREVFFDRLAERFDVGYVFQELNDLPPGFLVPPDRIKPWGTSHAALAAAGEVREPFAVINADDFYGKRAFEAMARFLGASPADGTSYALVGYRLDGTLSEHGTVARGVCEVDDNGFLKGIIERTNVGRSASGISFRDEHGRDAALGGTETVSMNFWGFTPTIFSFIREAFVRFLKEISGHPKAELYIPLVVNALILDGRADVRVLPCPEQWFGVTYREDKPRVVAAVRSLVKAGVYPARLWPPHPKKRP